MKSLARLHAQGNENDPWVLAEFEQIQEEVVFERENSARSYKELFNEKANLRRMILATACQAATQMTGVSAIQYYSLEIFVSTFYLEIRPHPDCEKGSNRYQRK